MENPPVLDIEHDGQPPWLGRLICIGWDGRVYEEHEFDELRKELAVAPAYATFTKHDAWYLRMQGWDLPGEVHDIQVMAWRLNENTPLDLAWCAQRYCQVEMDKRIKSIAKVPHFRTDAGRQLPLTTYWEWDRSVQQQMLDYCQRDIVTEATLYRTLRGRIEQTGWLDHWVNKDIPFTRTLLNMECYGLPLDMVSNQALHEELSYEAAQREHQLRSVVKLPDCFNLGSWDQLAELLFKRLLYVVDSIPHGKDLRKPSLIAAIAEADGIPKSKVPAEKVEEFKQFIVHYCTPPGFTVQKVTPKNLVGYWTVKGMALPSAKVPKADKKPRPKVDSKTLVVHFGTNPFIQDLIKWRKLTKVISTYTGAFDRRYYNGRVYGSFNQTGTVTGRLSSSKPNLQNIPAHGDLGPRVRGLFTGSFIIGDYSQLEPRLMAHYSQDPVLLDTYRSGKDIYLVTAEGIFGRTISKEDPERQIAKTLVLALGYGAGPRKLAEILSINGYPTDVGTAKGYFRELERLYHVLFEWKEGVVSYAKSKGYVRTIGGSVRRLKTTFEDRSWKTQGYGERQAVNAIIQGSAADIVREAMVNTTLRWPGRPLLAQVHDELIWEYNPKVLDAARPHVLQGIQEVCEDGHPFDLSVPLKFEPAFCTSWAEKGGFTPIMETEEDDDAE
jgi:DNA polymerase I-like protein with 3'-5' exonuclease and polymerase domains